MKINSKKIIVFLSFITFFSCGKKDETSFIKSIQEKGIEVCLIKDEPLVLSPLYDIEEIMSLGGEEPEPALFQPGECLVDDEGNLYFTDEGRIKKFNANGDFLHFIGNTGEGPGEINWPNLEQILGDSLVTAQKSIRSGTGKFVIFDLEGNFLKLLYSPVIKKQLFKNGKNYAKYYLGNNIFLFHASRENKRKDGMSYTSHKFGLCTTDGRFIKELDFHVNEYISGIEGKSRWMTRPLTMTDNPAYFHKKLYILSRNGKDIFIYDNTGELLKILSLTMKGTKIKSDEIDERLGRVDDPVFAWLERKVGKPDRKPAVYDIIVDDLDRIWLKKGVTFGISPSKIGNYTYTIINENGEYIADQILPIALEAVKNNRAYGFMTTEDDLRIFKEYRLIVK